MIFLKFFKGELKMKYEQSRDSFYTMVLEKLDDIQVIETTDPTNPLADSDQNNYILPEDVYIVEVDSEKVSTLPHNEYRVGDILFLRKARTNFVYSIVKVKYINNDTQFEVIDAFEPAILLKELALLSEGVTNNETI